VTTVEENGDKASRQRRRWIIGLSIVALLLAYSMAKQYTDYYKRFNKADRVAKGHVIEVDPGEPPSGAQTDDGDPGTPPSSHYQFQVDGKSYDGWIEDELSKGEPILIRYNSSDPSFNHAQDDHTTFVHKERHSLFLLFIVLAALGWCIRNRNPLEDHEPEIDIGDGSFDSLRKAMIQRVGRDLTPKEELKLRRLADRIQKAAEEERIAIRKLADAINSQLGSSGT
jgi:hypothetical protein